MDLIYFNTRTKPETKILFKIILLFSICQMYICADFVYTIEEGKRPGTYIGDIATDSNIMESIQPEDQSSIWFTLLQQKDSIFFRVARKTGKLYTSQILDAESICKRDKECFQLLDVVIHRGSSSIKILTIKVNIKDINDNSPIFPRKQINIEFEEGQEKGMKMSIPNAIDKDVSKNNSQISYELKNSQDKPFELMVSKDVTGASKLALELKEILDREKQDTYKLQLIAKDSGSPHGESVLDILVSVTDINDNAPVFAADIYKVYIKDKPNKMSHIITVLANDADLGENGKISYHFNPNTSKSLKNHFILNEETGEISLKDTFGEHLVQILYIDATDQGQPPLSTTATLSVIKVGNNPPVIRFTFRDKKIYVSEDMGVGSFIAYIEVIDNNIGLNGNIFCFIFHDKVDLVTLGKSVVMYKYGLRLKNSLDREKADHHDVVIRCHNFRSPLLHSNSKFSIQVMDINDVRPEFTKDTFKFFINENQNSRITLGYINATDPDLGDGGKLTYSLITNNNKHFLPFKITTNGLLSAIMSLDHEFQHTYHFKVFVKDNGTPSLNNTVNVIVEVTDKNDNAPYFTFPSVKPYNLHVTYYPDARNKNITQIKAADSDSQENAFLKYQIIRGNDKQMFTINQYTGFLAFNRQLSQQNAGSYQLDILVKDSGRPVLSATTTLFLTLTISNNTSEMLNVVQLHTEEKVHLNLVIIITVIAVTIAVFITASLSICIIRCNGQSNVAYAQALDPSNRYVGEQRQLIASSYPGNTWPHPSQPLQINQAPSINTPMTTPKRQINSAGVLPPKTLPQSDVSSQMYTQNVSIPPDYFTWRSTVPSQSEADMSWREENAPHDQQRADLSSRKLSVQSGHVNKSDISAPYPQSRNLIEMNNEQTSNTRPLPPVPK